MDSIIIPTLRAGESDASLTIEPDAYGDSYTLTLAVAGRIVAQGEDFRPGASRDFGDGDAAAYTVQTFGAFLAHAIESSEPDARDGWPVLSDDASEWTDALALYADGDVSESDAIAYLLRDGNLRVPCSRYGDDTATCAPIAYRLARYVADESGEPLTLADVDYAMSLVVNDHDVSDLLGLCPLCGDVIDYCQGHGEGEHESAYLLSVATVYVRERRAGADDDDALHYAFGVTEVPATVDALSDPTDAEILAVREISRTLR